MTGFRQIENLHAYSGGTVRDSHPVFYSPTGLLPRPQALKRNIYLHGQYTRLACKSQSKKDIFEIYIPPPGLCGVGGFAIIGIKVPRLAATKPGRADQNRQIKAGAIIITQPAGKRKRYLYEKDHCIIPVGCYLF